MFAAKYGHCDCLRWMVEEAGADIRIRASDDSDVFAWAVFGADIETMETVASLLEPAELHRTNKFGCSAVHWAATGGSVVVLKWLYARGLDFNLINDNHFGAVSKAAFRGHRDALEWMLVDKEGPSLLWQLRPVPDPEKTFETLEGLMKEGGYTRVSEFLKVNSADLPSFI